MAAERRRSSTIRNRFPEWTQTASRRYQGIWQKNFRTDRGVLGVFWTSSAEKCPTFEKVGHLVGHLVGRKKCRICGLFQPFYTKWTSAPLNGHYIYNFAKCFLRSPHPHLVKKHGMYSKKSGALGHSSKKPVFTAFFGRKSAPLILRQKWGTRKEGGNGSRGEASAEPRKAPPEP